MSTPRSVDLPDGVVAAFASTPRGGFATLRCTPTRGPVRGNACLVPGFTGSKEDFLTILPLLATHGWDVVTYDQRGQYETPADRDADFSLQGLAADTVTLCGAVFGPAPVQLLGHSFGGLVAATASIEHPARWRSLTVMCSGLVGFGTDRQDLVMFAQSAGSTDLEQIYEANREINRLQGIAEETPAIEAFLKKRFLANSPDSLAAFAGHLLTTNSLAAPLAGSGVPVQMMRGETDDAWSHEVQDEVAAVVGTSVVVVPDAGHSPAVDQPEATVALLNSFWSPLTTSQEG